MEPMCSAERLSGSWRNTTDSLAGVKLYLIGAIRKSHAIWDTCRTVCAMGLHRKTKTSVVTKAVDPETMAEAARQYIKKSHMSSKF